MKNGKIGETTGLAASTCSREHVRAEQVYVRRSSERVDPDGSHPIELDAWVGFGSVGRMRVTRHQATDLIGLLAQALVQTEPEAVTS